MLKNILIAGLMATCGGAIAAAQAPAQSGGQQPPAERQPAQAERAANQPVTLVGCLYRESVVPGRTPNVAERTGVLEDYILADAQMAGQSGTTSPGATSTTPAPTGTAGSAAAAGKMYKVENIDDEKLADLVGKRVEVMGRIDAEPGDAPPPTGAATGPVTERPDRSVGPDRIELPEFEATSIREVSGTCPPTPKPRQ